MATHRRRMIVAGLAMLAALPAWGLARSAAPPPPAPGKFVFHVVESFDARYLGDTPGHLGRGGGQGEAAPGVALGDPVYRGDEKIGRVTGLLWDRSKGSLEVEFDPEQVRVDSHGRALGPLRIAIGDEVWLALGGRTSAPQVR